MKRIKAFTLVEVLVAMTIFSVVITLATGAFLSLSRLQRKSLIMRETQQNARVALEAIAKDAREANRINIDAGSSLVLWIPEKGNDGNTYTTTILYYISGKDLVKESRLTYPTTQTITSKITDSSRGTLAIRNLTFVQRGNTLDVSFWAQNQVSATDVYDKDVTEIKTSILLEGI